MISSRPQIGQPLSTLTHLNPSQPISINLNSSQPISTHFFLCFFVVVAKRPFCGGSGQPSFPTLAHLNPSKPPCHPYQRISTQLNPSYSISTHLNPSKKNLWQRRWEFFSVLVSALVERFWVSCMRDFYEIYDIKIPHMGDKASLNRCG